MGNLKISHNHTHTNTFGCYCFFTSKDIEQHIYALLKDKSLIISNQENDTVILKLAF